MAQDETFPRPLTAREAETLRFMLSPADPRLVCLREQAGVAVVTGKCPCGCATIDLSVDRAKASGASGLCHAAINARTPKFDPALGPKELIVFLEEGWLNSLEVVYYSDQPPHEFPAIDDFDPPRLAC
jgi:hypothetical protein